MSINNVGSSERSLAFPNPDNAPVASTGARAYSPISVTDLPISSSSSVHKTAAKTHTCVLNFKVGGAGASGQQDSHLKIGTCYLGYTGRSQLVAPKASDEPKVEEPVLDFTKIYQKKDENFLGSYGFKEPSSVPKQVSSLEGESDISKPKSAVLDIKAKLDSFNKELDKLEKSTPKIKGSIASRREMMGRDFGGLVDDLFNQEDYEKKDITRIKARLIATESRLKAITLGDQALTDLVSNSFGEMIKTINKVSFKT